MAAERQKTAALMTNGILGQARVEKISSTGTTISEHPRVVFKLTVTIPGRDPYAVTLTQGREQDRDRKLPARRDRRRQGHS